MNAADINTVNDQKLFSVCSLVTDFSEYQEMLDSFEAAGFNEENSEFFYADNSKGNQYDGFEGLKRFLNSASGTYIILCHQDILLKYDTMDDLLNRIDEVDRLDPDWALLGNAGYMDFNNVALRITDPHGENRDYGPYPARVKSLDENFIVVKKEANLAISHDLHGFHLYGTDMCIIADILGYNSYVINFHLYHKSGGTCSTNFYEIKQTVIDKYQRALKPKYIRTPATNLFLSSNRLLNLLLNKKIMYSVKKRYDFLYEKLGK